MVGACYTCAHRGENRRETSRTPRTRIPCPPTIEDHSIESRHLRRSQREQCAQTERGNRDAYRRLAILEEIADDADTSPSDRIRAIDLLAKYGLGALQAVSDEVVHAKLAASINIIEALVPADIQPNLLARLQGVWDGQ